MNKYRLVLLFSLVTLVTGCLPAPPEITLPPISSTVPKLSVPEKVTLLLPLTGPLGKIGQSIQQGYFSAYQASPLASTLTLKVINTETLSLDQLYEKATEASPDLIIGPLLKSSVQEFSTHSESNIPTIALNYLPEGASVPAQFYQFGLSPLDEVRQALQLAARKHLHRALIIAPQGEWGNSLTQGFTETWKKFGGSISDVYQYSNANVELNKGIRTLLRFSPPNVRRHDFDVIFLAASPKMARQIKPLLKFYFAGQIPVYATALIYNGVPQPRLDNDLNQIIFCASPSVFDQAVAAGSSSREVINNGVMSKERYFSLGADAFLLTQNLPYLDSSRNEPLNGTTGLLKLGVQGKIHRIVPCAMFINGIPTLLNDSATSSTWPPR